MKTEIEAKFTDIDAEKLREQLQTLGASMVYSEHLVRQKVFDFSDDRLDRDRAWVRLREENGKAILTFKKWVENGIIGMQEAETGVTSFEAAERFLLALGMVERARQEKKRELWHLGEVEIMIDTWPWIPTFVEIEAPSETAVRETARVLGFDDSQAMFGGVSRIYMKYFSVTDDDIDHCPILEFGPVPEWLEAKRLEHPLP